MKREDLEKLSDREIEYRISADLWKKRCIDKKQWNNTAQRTYKEIQSGDCVYADARYCESPNDIMPLVFESGINLNLEEGDEGRYYSCTSGVDGHEYGKNCADHENPLRAAAIVYLLMQGNA